MNSRKLIYSITHQGAAELNELERSCTNAVLPLLTPSSSRKFVEQLNCLSFVSKLSGDKLILFKFGRLEPDSLFRNRQIEFVFATTLVEGGPFQTRCDILIENGRLAGLKLNRSLDANITDPVISCRLWSDPDGNLSSEVYRGGKSVDAIRAYLPVDTVLEPAPSERQAAFFSRFAASIPSGFSQLISETDGFQVDGHSFRGTRSREIVWPECNIHVLLEDDDCRLAVCLVEKGDELTPCVMDQVTSTLLRVDASWLDLVDVYVRAYSDYDEEEGVSTELENRYSEYVI
jgi:hypothetical protein